MGKGKQSQKALAKAKPSVTIVDKQKPNLEYTLSWFLAQRILALGVSKKKVVKVMKKNRGLRRFYQDIKDLSMAVARYAYLQLENNI